MKICEVICKYISAKIEKCTFTYNNDISNEENARRHELINVKKGAYYDVLTFINDLIEAFREIDK